jgi:hypothetical protein
MHHCKISATQMMLSLYTRAFVGGVDELQHTTECRDKAAQHTTHNPLDLEPRTPPEWTTCRCQGGTPLVSKCPVSALDIDFVIMCNRGVVHACIFYDGNKLAVALDACMGFFDADTRH